MPIVKIHLEKSGNEEKLPLGPIIDPNPGPTLDIDVAAPEIAVTKSRPLNDSNAVITKKISKYMYINEITEAINLLSTGFWSYFRTKIPFGKIIFFKWFWIKEYKICILNIFIPHVVEPAQPPINIRPKNKIIGKLPQSSYLAFTYPVPVKIEITLKTIGLKFNFSDESTNK